MNNYSKILLRFAALFGVVGALLGAHMAGSGSFEFKAIHAHILVVGWLSLFSWAVFYKIFYRQVSMLANVHVWSAIIGSFGLTIGMWFQFINPFGLSTILILSIYIAGGTVLLISYIIFFILTFFYKENGAS